MNRALLALLFVGCFPATAQTNLPDPVIAPFGIAHGASSRAGLTAELARGGIFLVRGAWLGPDDLVVAQPPFLSELDDARIEIRSLESGTVYSAAMVHAWSFQLAGILPIEIPAGPAEITTVYQDRRSAPVEMLVVDSLPGLFAVSQQGFGSGVIQNFVSPSEQPLNTLTNPAKPGQYIILWGTGLGDASLANVQVRIGDVLSIEPYYAGPAPGLPGVDQYNVALPASKELLEGCYVPVSVSAGGGTSGQVTVSISNEAGTCDHPWQLPQETLDMLDTGGRIKTLRVFVGDNEPILPPGGPEPLTTRWLTAFADLELANATGVALRSPDSERPASSGRLLCGGAVGAILTSGDFSPLPQPPPPPNPALVAADAGEALTFLGPGGRSFALRRTSPPDEVDVPAPPGSYQFTQPGITDLLVPGDWVLEAPGGADTEAFSAAVALPPLPAVAVPAVVDFDQGITIEWNGGDYAPSDSVSLMVGVQVPDEREPSRTVFRGGFCSIPAIDGEMTMSAAFFADLPIPTDGMAVWRLSLRAPRELLVPQLDHAELTFDVSRSQELPIAP